MSRKASSPPGRGKGRPAIIVLLSLFCLLASLPARALPARTVFVRLFEALVPVKTVYVEGPLAVESPQNLTIGAGLCAIQSEEDRLVFRPVSQSGAARPLTAHSLVLRGLGPRGLAVRYSTRITRHYRGIVRVMLDERGNLSLVNAVPVVDYVASVVGSETLSGWPPEALKCQAVLTQTRLARYKPGDALGDSTTREAYLGSDYERPPVRLAVVAVLGQKLVSNGVPIVAFYHACCAGKTSSGEEYFNKKAGSVPYLQGVSCAYCVPAPFCRPTVKVIPATVFKKAFPMGPGRVVARDGAARPIAVEFANGFQISGYDFWIKLGQKLGWDKCPGTRFKLEAEPDGSVRIESTGAGHGVGLCQWGAAEQARAGKSYKEILRYYFPAADLAGDKQGRTLNP